MDHFLLKTFQIEVATQCKFVLMSARDLQSAEVHMTEQMTLHLAAYSAASAKRESNPDTLAAITEWRDDFERAKALLPSTASYMTRTWLALQGIVVSAANISKLLWGNGGKHEQERGPLRASLNVDNDSVVRDPNLRNDFEHFDDRLQGLSSNYFGRNIGPLKMVEGSGDVSASHFGHYDPQAGVVSFWTHSVSIPAIVAEAARILTIAKGEGVSTSIPPELRDFIE